MVIKPRYLIAVAAVAVTAGTVALVQTATAAPSPASPSPSATATATSPSSAPASTDPAADGSRAVIAFYTLLTADQRQCLADAGLQRAEGRLSAEQQAALRTAVDEVLTACGIKLPDRIAGLDKLGFGYASLTPDQQQCLADAELTRPVGRLTDVQRAAVRQSKLGAATACGVGR